MREGRGTYRLGHPHRLTAGLGAHAGKGAERVVCEDVYALSEKLAMDRGGMEEKTYPVVRLKIVHLLSEDQRPEVLAQKLNHVKGVVKPRPVARESVRPCQHLP